MWLRKIISYPTSKSKKKKKVLKGFILQLFVLLQPLLFPDHFGGTHLPWFSHQRATCLIQGGYQSGSLSPVKGERLSHTGDVWAHLFQTLTLGWHKWLFLPLTTKVIQAASSDLVKLDERKSAFIIGNLLSLTCCLNLIQYAWGVLKRYLILTTAPNPHHGVCSLFQQYLTSSFHSCKQVQITHMKGVLYTGIQV